MKNKFQITLKRGKSIIYLRNNHITSFFDKKSLLKRKNVENLKSLCGFFDNTLVSNNKFKK